jgi:hypothetical protein
LAAGWDVRIVISVVSFQEMQEFDVFVGSKTFFGFSIHHNYFFNRFPPSEIRKQLLNRLW